MEHSLIVLEGLLQGREIKMGDYTYILDDNKKLCVVATVEGKEEKRLVGVDMSLGWFIKLCDELSDGEIVIIGANNALNKIKRRRA